MNPVFDFAFAREILPTLVSALGSAMSGRYQPN